jgi:uncharacterized GH25 family protein
MKKLNLQTRLLAGCAALALLVPVTAEAHRSWLLPSGTIFSGEQPWVTVDAASSNDIFYFEHNASSLDNLVITAPDGTQVKGENQAKTRYRSVFDLKLEQQGTYRIALVNKGMFATYKLNGETKRLRGTMDTLRKDIPANAEELSVTESKSRVETFVTKGKPSTQSLQPTNDGLELVSVNHPNDLVAGESAVLRFLNDGKPAAGFEAVVILAGSRYRDKLSEMRLTTDQNGEIKVQWPEAGMYWVNVTPKRPARPEAEMDDEDDDTPATGKPAAQSAAKPSPQPVGKPAGTFEDPVKRSGYSLTLEVMPG